MKINVNNPHINLKNATNNACRSGISTPSFGASAADTFARHIGKKTVTYFNAQKLAESIDDIYGDDRFFSTLLQKANLDTQGDKLTVKKSSFLGDVVSALSYPFVDMPSDIVNATLGGLRKIHLDSLADKISNIGYIDTMLKKHESKKSMDLVYKILDQFSSASGSNSIQDHIEPYSKLAMGRIKVLAKNYKSRDERTLNRIATATVSAIYSAKDFFNISLLENDDKEKAQEAKKARFKQEMTRMGLSAGLTYFSLGVFEKYTKGNILLDSLVIAGSALFSEVVSRIIHKTPLTPLSPEKAAQIALENTQEFKDNRKTKVEIESPKTTKDEEIKNIFAMFAKDNGNIASVDKLNHENVEGNKKKPHLSVMQKIGIAVAIASAAFMAKKGICGEYGAKLKRRELYSSYKYMFDYMIKNPSVDNDLDSKLLRELKSINSNAKARSERWDILKKIKDKITRKEITINIKELKNNLLELKNAPESKKIQQPLDYYCKAVEKFEDAGIETITPTVKRNIAAPLFDGVTKIAKTIYTILSAPAQLVDLILNKALFDKSETVLQEVNDRIISKGNMPKYLFNEYQHELKEFYRFFEKYKDSSNKNAKIASIVEKRTRNFESQAETSALANLSRTFVTLISTYFFVNDYSNRVLIESGGKNVEEAREVRNERIAHKISNFIINGTLMNLFNAMGRGPLNNSLIAATAIAAGTETCNEFLIRKSICQPTGQMESRQAIIDFENKNLAKGGIGGWWTRTFKRITGKKSLTQKAGVQETSTRTQQK